MPLPSTHKPTMETTPKKNRAPRKVASVEPYSAKSARGFDSVDGVKMLDGGTVKVVMTSSRGYLQCALNAGDVVLAPPNVAASFIAGRFAKKLK